MAESLSLEQHLEDMARPEVIPDISLMVQGGGMRGAYSMAVLAALEEIGALNGVDYRNAFLSAIGSSAGALNLAHYAAGHAQEGIDVYTYDLTDGRFMPRLDSVGAFMLDAGRVVARGLRPANVDFLVDDVLQRQGQITEFEGKMADSVYVVLTDAETGEPVAVRMSPDDPEVNIYELFRATAALPSLYNKIVEVAGGRYVDGGTTSSVPLASAVDLKPQPKQVLTILTREHGYRNQPRNFLRGFLYRSGAIMLARGKQSEAIKKLIVGGNEINFNSDIERLESENGIDPVSGIRFTLIQPSDPKYMVSRMTTNKRKIADCVKMAKEDTARVLEETLVPAAA